MNEGTQQQRPPHALAAFLSKERSTILAAWREAVEQDPELTTASSVSRAQFNDHIPEVLDAFERQLRASDAETRERAVEQEQESAAEHGLHRWQQGYDQRETMREWGHLQLCLLEAVDRFGQSRPDLHAQVLQQSRRAVVRLCNAGVCESASRYTKLLRAEATSRLHELEQALEQVRLLERQRAESWREAAHDLRGSVSVISSAVAVLNRDDVPSSVRPERLLRKGVISLHEMLTDLLSLARLEAGQERRQVALFDVAELMKEFCDAMRPLAAERSLFLRCEGPASLTVESDSAKVRRIAQNLVLNALRATDVGGVTVSWAKGEAEHPTRWVLSIHDTGPGFAAESAPPLARALAKATESADHVEHVASSQSAHASISSQGDLGMRSGSSKEIAGEGIGLSIVKRLCELLDASVELHSSPQGSTFRLTFPSAYPAPSR